MRAALREAKRGLGHTSPNPAVGAVLVNRGKIVARGYHRRSGAPHAEIACLRAARGSDMKDATLYVTLEPCSTRGRTGPCTSAIIESGIKRVVVGVRDPNPAHNGRSLGLLRAAGVDATEGVLEGECAALNDAFNKWIQTRRPFVVAKCAMTLDGRLTLPAAAGRWITNATSRRNSHALRAAADAIIIGAKTLRADDPRLTVRGIRGAKQPWRVVLSRSRRLPKKSRVFTDRHRARTIVHHYGSLKETLDELGKNEIISVLIEGGGDILSQALDGRLIDKLVIYIAPIFGGGPVLAFGGHGAAASSEGTRLRDIHYEKIGDDICLTGYPVYQKSGPQICEAG